MMLENLEKDQIDRLWEFRKLVMNAFYNRLNFFLIFESVLLGVVGILSSKSSSTMLALKIMTALGLTLTVFWGYTQARQKYLLDDINSYMKSILPEYKAILERRAKWPLSTLWVETYILPALVALIWIVFLLFLQ